jgi:SAM-dependent methyltransferase
MTAGENETARPLGLDKSQPNIARVYDYWLGGKNNFQADREEAERLIEVQPHLPRLARENRMFLRNAVHWLATERGIRQFLDAGSGLPTANNTHDIAQSAAPGSKVAYVDKDPVVVSHAGALLADGHGVTAIRGDVADPAAILADPRVNALVQPGEPCAVILAAVLHFFSPDDARRVITEFARLTAPGSYLVASVGISGTAIAREYRPGSVYNYTPDEIRALLAGLTIIDPPGIVDARSWAPGIPVTSSASTAQQQTRVLAAVAQTS